MAARNCIFVKCFFEKTQKSAPLQLNFECSGVFWLNLVTLDAECRLHHRNHQDNKPQQIDRQDGKRYRIAEESEQRRNKRRTDISACHLDSNNRSRIFRPEIIWCGMDNARVNRRTPQTYHKKSCKRDRIGLHRKAQDKNPADKNPGFPAKSFYGRQADR